MKLKPQLLTLTAASVLAFGTAFAAQDRPAEPIGQPGASSTEQPGPAATREIGEQEERQVGDASASGSYDSASAEDEDSDVVEADEPQAQMGADTGPQDQPPSSDVSERELGTPEGEADDSATGAGTAGGESDVEVDAEADVQAEAETDSETPVVVVPAETPQQSASGVAEADEEPSAGGGQAGGSLETEQESSASLESSEDAGAGQAGGMAESEEDVQVQQGHPVDESAAAGEPAEPQQVGAGQAGGMSQQQYDRQTIEQVQQALNDKGFHSGNVDGLMGPKTSEALRNFQEKEGIQASGELDEETLSSLGVDKPAG